MPQTIMVLDDDQDISLLICALLAEEGYTTTAPTWAITDLDLPRESVPDLIILLNKDVTTLAIIEQLKAQPDLAAIPLIVCTGAVKEVAELKGRLTTSGVRVVLKPFDIDDLLLNVSEMITAAS